MGFSWIIIQSSIYRWDFLGLSSNHPFIDGIFHCKPWVVYFMEHPKLKWMRTAGTPHFFSSKTMGIFWASTIWRDKPTYSSPRGVEISPSLSGRRVVLIFMEGTLKWPLDGYHKAERCNKPWPCHQTWQWRADCWRPICHRSVSKIGYSTSPWWGSQHFFGDFIMKNMILCDMIWI